MLNIIKKKVLSFSKKNVHAIDNKKNEIKSNYAIYNENLKLLESIGPTQITTSESYILEGSDIIFDNLNGFIISENNTIITDQDKNKFI